MSIITTMITNTVTITIMATATITSRYGAASRLHLFFAKIGATRLNM